MIWATGVLFSRAVRILTFSDDRMVPVVEAVHTAFPDCAITLSLGERSLESYQRLHAAGGRRYLLRHETISPVLYGRLHPESMSLKTPGSVSL